MAEKKIFKKETEGTVTVEDLVQSGQDVTNSSNSGLFNTPTLGIAPTYNRSLNEKCTGQPDNAPKFVLAKIDQRLARQVWVVKDPIPRVSI